MTQRRIWIAACLLAVVLGLPRTASAGLLEVIIEMSGPRMFGISFECRRNLFDGSWSSCKAAGGGAPVSGEGNDKRPSRVKAVLFGRDTRSKVWLAVGGGAYFSAPKKLNVHEFEGGDVAMATFDPMLEFESVSIELCDCGSDGPAVQLYHGVLGVTMNYLFVADSSDTFNVGFKVRPIGIALPISKKWSFDFSYDLRLYPSGFTPADFGRPSEPVERKPEVVQALVFGLRWKLGNAQPPTTPSSVGSPGPQQPQQN